MRLNRSSRNPCQFCMAKIQTGRFEEVLSSPIIPSSSSFSFDCFMPRKRTSSQLAGVFCARRHTGHSRVVFTGSATCFFFFESSSSSSSGSTHSSSSISSSSPCSPSSPHTSSSSSSSCSSHSFLSARVLQIPLRTRFGPRLVSRWWRISLKSFWTC